MPYTPELKELIKRVEKTRPARAQKKRGGVEFTPMSLQERETILKYHPDFKEEGRTEILVGPNKGYRIAKEMVQILHAKSRLDPDTVDLGHVDYETDALIIGAGAGGRGGPPPPP